MVTALQGKYMTGYEYALREMEKSEMYREDERIILEYCREIREKRAAEKGKEITDERQVPDEC